MENKEALDALKDIRSMMEKSTKCLSLSGLSGIFMGIYALAGVGAVKWILQHRDLWSSCQMQCYLFAVALLVLILAVATAGFFSERRARKSGQSILNKTARKMHIDLFTHLLPGGIMSIAMGISGHTQFISSVMLTFYGLALISASKYTFKDITHLGWSMLGLGLVNCFLTQYSLIFWSIGFGVFHIIYGTVMYFKYDRKNA